jgi:16S rRNA (guanine527-N7)-methyltransferase
MALTRISTRNQQSTINNRQSTIGNVLAFPPSVSSVANPPKIASTIAIRIGTEKIRSAFIRVNPRLSLLLFRPCRSADVGLFGGEGSNFATLPLMQPARIAALLSPFLGGVSLSDSQLAQLASYLDLLLRWNARINLTAVRDPEQIVTRHFGESLFAARHLYPSCSLETGDWSLLDIGSGPGFPGLPIKIWAPALSTTLLESNQRKATFLREVVRALELTGVQVVSDRAENFAAQIANYKLPITNSVTITLRAVERFHQILLTAVELLQQFPTASRRLALLIGASQVEPARALALTWADPVPIPASSQRVLLVGNSL